MSRIVRSAVGLGLSVVLSMTCAACLDLEPTHFIDYYGPKAQAPQSIAGTDVALPQLTSAPASAPATMAVLSGEPLVLGVNDAVLLTLENNRSFAVQRYAPRITYTGLDLQRAVFDPVLAGQTAFTHTRRPLVLQTAGGEDKKFTGLESLSASLSLSQFLPTGTAVALTGSTAVSDVGGPLGDTSRLDLDVTQKLLRGGGMDVNLASLRQAKIDFEASQYELRGFAEALIATAEQTYWDYVLAQKQIVIFEQSLALARQQLNEVRERVKVGKLAETEVAAAEAEVALREENLIVARATLQTTRLNLLRLVNPSLANLWERQVDTTDEPVIPDIRLPDVENYVQVAMRLRPDLNQARLQIERGDLELVKTRNGLLPRLDAFANLGKPGFGPNFGRSVSRVFDESAYDVTVGVSGDYPVLNRGARAANERAQFSRDQSAEAVANLEQLVQVEVRSAYITVIRTKEEVAATAVTVRAQQETLRAETEKFQVGKSTSFLVAQAQRDLVQSQIANIQAIVDCRKAIVDLYRLDGSLLIRRGIAAPGNKPVAMTAPVRGGGNYQPPR